MHKSCDPFVIEVANSIDFNSDELFTGYQQLPEIAANFHWNECFLILFLPLLYFSMFVFIPVSFLLDCANIATEVHLKKKKIDPPVPCAWHSLWGQWASLPAAPVVPRPLCASDRGVCRPTRCSWSCCSAAFSAVRAEEFKPHSSAARSSSNLLTRRTAIGSKLHGWELESNALGYSGTDGEKNLPRCRVSGGKEKELLSRSNTLTALPWDLCLEPRLPCSTQH